MKFQKSYLASVIAASLLSMGAQAQNAGFIKSQMESDLEHRLRADITAIAGEGRYNLDLDIALDYAAPVAPANSSADIVSAMKQAQQICDSLLSTDGTEQKKVALKGLPGLPAAPSASNNQATSQAQGIIAAMTSMIALKECQNQFQAITAQANKPAPQSKELEVKNISVALTVDDDLSEQAIELIRASIVSKSDLDLLRGDILNINKFEFDALPAGFMGNLSKISDDYPWLFAGGLLLAAILLYFALTRRKAQLEPVSVATAKASSIAVKDDSLEKAHAILNTIIAKKMHSPDIWSQVLSSNADSAEESMPAVYSLLGRSGIKTLFGKRANTVIDGIAEQATDLTDQEVLAGIASLEQLSIVETSKEEASNKLNPFAFLSKLEAGQVFQLIKDENTSTQSRVLTQLDDSILSTVLHGFQTQDRADLLIGLAQIESVDQHELVAIAEKLSVAARKLPVVKHVAASGVNVVGTIIDTLSEPEQIQALQDIRKTAPDTYVSLRERMLLWQDITRVKSSELGALLMDLEPTLIANAIADSTDAEKQFVLSTVASGFRSRIKAALPQEDSEIEDGLTLSSRSALTKAMRSALKAGTIVRDNLKPLNLDASVAV